jgi:hypothetical protein
MRHLSEDWPEIRPRPHLGGCACRCCRGRRADRYIERLASQSLSTALRHAQDPWEGEAGATLARLRLEAGGGKAPAGPGSPRPPGRIPCSIRLTASSAVPLGALGWSRDHMRRGALRLYIVYRQATPLYVGHVHGRSQSVAEHVMAYRRGEGIGGPASDTARLHRELTTAPGQISVVALDWHHPTFPRTPDMTRSIEGLLRAVVRPTIHTAAVTTFEEDEADAV